MEFRPVIPDPEKIVCLVRNYLEHHHEVTAAGAQVSLAEHPPIFCATRDRRLRMDSRSFDQAPPSSSIGKANLLSSSVKQVVTSQKPTR